MSDLIEDSYAEWLLQEEDARLNYYSKCQRYYDGQHLIMAPDKYLELVKRHYGIKINYCEPIVEAPVSRLTVESISCDDPETLKALNKIWKYNRMDAKTIKFHRNGIKKGDAFAQVWPHFPPNGDKPDKYEIKFLTPDIILPIYESDDSESLVMVRKQWTSFNADGQPVAHKWLFYPDRIERYYRILNRETMSMNTSDYTGLDWWPDDTDGFDWTLNNPYGMIPIIHFRNKEDDSPFGTSELHNAFAVQDGINKLVIDLMRTADFQAFKQRYITGIDEDQLPVNPDTGRHELQSNPGDVWRFPSGGPDNQVTVGELSDTNPAGILASIDKLVDHLCSITRTPKSTLQDSAGTASSGFALSKVEAPLLDKVREKQISFGNSYEDLNKLLIVQMQYHNDLPKGEVPETSIEWESSTSESAEEKLYGAQKKQILKQNNVISAKQWAKEEGYTDEEIAQMQADTKAESEQSTANLLGHSFGNENLE
jgi:hypothetical protein